MMERTKEDGEIKRENTKRETSRRAAVRALSFPNGLRTNRARETLCSKPWIYAHFTFRIGFIPLFLPTYTVGHREST